LLDKSYCVPADAVIASEIRSWQGEAPAATERYYHRRTIILPPQRTDDGPNKQEIEGRGEEITPEQTDDGRNGKAPASVVHDPASMDRAVFSGGLRDAPGSDSTTAPLKSATGRARRIKRRSENLMRMKI
jgi:hypothetical protein